MGKTSSQNALENLRYHIKTYGCQMNYSDSERLSGLLESYGYKNTDEIEDASLVIFNTCSIKQKAEDKVLGSMKSVAKLKKQNPDLLIGITGCMTRIPSTKNSEDKDNLFKQVKDLDVCFPIKDLTKLPALLKDLKPELAEFETQEADLNNYFKIQPKYKTSFQAYIPIMTGCDKFCTYCIVPYSRGREVSRPIEDIVKEAKRLVEEGCLELTLLGQNVNSYGLSWIDQKSGNFTYDENPFVQLLKAVDKIEGLKRLRFTSPHPQDMKHDVVDFIAESKTVMPCLHMPLQSGSDYILKKMNRNYNSQQFRESIEYIRKKIPGCSITTDMIVGFCGETDEHYQESLDFFREMCFDLAFISQYSTRKGTVAGMLKKDDVPKEVKTQRWHKMNDVLRETSFINNKRFAGKTVKVLVEKFSDRSQKLHGRSEHFKEVVFEGSKDLIGKIVEVKIDKCLEWLLEGTLI